MSDVLKSRKLLGIGAVVLLSLVILGLVRLLAWPTSPPPWPELVQTEEWRNWRKQIHEKLSAGSVTESTLAEALNIKLPARPEHAAAALRRDQAIADVLMAYPEVRKILKNRFGIYADTFLGTGLSKPSFSALKYGEASVHEYLIKNLRDDHPAVSMWKLDPNKNPKDMTMTVQELVESDPKPDNQMKPWVKEIAQRVKEKNMVIPVMIRFARLDAVEYSHRLGLPERSHVFASNIAEVWNMRVRDAAHFSGYTVDKGDSVYIWVFRPNDPVEVIPATWSEVLSHLPKWLSEIDKH